ncbi:hypothetical protein CFAM422_000749 [Trichoderma lentiforme]|uniref:Uncharacterized protein n=1 Tax=Trichoderma lentiforme TaxID=1567552 RepID=A0A9P4XRC9_9HYPO|nr:hypothetical protein CFAM422_000749 [Trichoderma lentiforme]
MKNEKAVQIQHRLRQTLQRETGDNQHRIRSNTNEGLQRPVTLRQGRLLENLGSENGAMAEVKYAARVLEPTTATA